MLQDSRLPTACNVLRVLAYAQLQNNQPGNARTLLTALAHLGHLDVRSRAMKALAELRSGAPADALATLQEGADKAEDMALFHLVRAQAYMKQGRATLARAAMQRYVSLRGQPPDPAPGS
ncbi:tetratricopeptide repeat protein [Bordetella genomosp. 10]|uniref:type III secretion apparatus assembly chaperone SctY n=1 Tax=Bordetella genomosp. 10 TaxID=1416804 RepID=UPI00117748CF|nr:tetratricopeptide repeat protein [Bordetella genomosp. 10]